MDHADVVKGLHKSLRKKFKEGISPENIWEEHLSDNKSLKNYASSMHNLATEHWEENSSNNRINWCKNTLKLYFEENGMEKSVKKEEKTKLFETMRRDCVEETEEEAQRINVTIANFLVPWKPLLNKRLLLDVGSCFNPFKRLTDSYHAIGIDISPATEDVLFCDFLNVNIIDLDVWRNAYTEDISLHTVQHNLKDGNILAQTFDVVVFSLLLSYFPSPAQRLKCCQNAYNALQWHGLLLIITPDSSHQNRHVLMMKSWKYALESIGFTRFKYEKLDHLHCMAYRKSKQNMQKLREDLTDSFYIPQDSQELEEVKSGMQSREDNISYDEKIFSNIEL